MRHLGKKQRNETTIGSLSGARAQRAVPRWLTVGVLALVAMSVLGCGAELPDGNRADPPGQLQEALCSPGDAGGDFGCGCTLNSQCSGFDDDSRLIVCDVVASSSVGKCLDCPTATPRPVGCACSTDSDCELDAKCNGRTCQKLRDRGEFCVRDTDCGTDASGAMRCLPTKSWCGPLAETYYCDFDADCLSGTCRAGACTVGTAGSACRLDGDCTSPLVCLTLPGLCGAKLPDGQPCKRNFECENQCNSFSGRCTLGTSGTLCTPGNPDGDCATGLACQECAGAYTCRPTGGTCP